MRTPTTQRTWAVHAIVVLATVALSAVIAAAPTSTPSGPATRPTIIYIVRHAEKDLSSGENPHLIETGHRRAEELAFMFDQIALDAIYVSINAQNQTIHRTKETVAPLVEAKELPATTYAELGWEALARRITDQHAGQTILICGHSHTIPNLLGELQVKGDVKVNSYDDLFVVILTRNDQGAIASRTLQRLRYR